jgi:hypothetical protein
VLPRCLLLPPPLPPLRWAPQLVAAAAAVVQARAVAMGAASQQLQPRWVREL